MDKVHLGQGQLKRLTDVKSFVGRVCFMCGVTDNLRYVFDTTLST